MATDKFQRFMAKVDVRSAEGCWIWLGGHVGRGYGAYYADGKQRPAHRVSFEFFNGPLDEDLEIDHLCRTRNCVNPWHLEQVTHRKNSMRGIAPSMVIRRSGKCLHGHKLEGKNLIVRKNKKHGCRSCDNRRALLYYHKKKTKV